MPVSTIPPPAAEFFWITSVQGYNCFNRVFYRAGGPLELAMLGPFLAEAIANVVTFLPALLSDEVVIQVTGARLYSGTDIWEQTELTPRVGLNEGDPLPNQDTCCFKLHMGEVPAGRIRRGHINISGCPEALVENNVWTPAFATAADDFRTGLMAVVTVAGTVFAPGVFSPKDGVIYDLTSVDLVPTPRTLRRRRPAAM